MASADARIVSERSQIDENGTQMEQGKLYSLFLRINESTRMECMDTRNLMYSGPQLFWVHQFFLLVMLRSLQIN